MSQDKSGKPSGAGRWAILIAVGVALAVGVAFFQERITSFFAQEGWNPGAASSTVTRFIGQAHAPNGGDSATALLNSEDYKTEVRDGRLVSITRGEGMARQQYALKAIAPTAEVKQAKAELLAMDGGSYRVVVQYANGKWGEFRVRKKDGARRIVGTPILLFDDVPPRSISDY